jgi:tRNA pseudouridine55 synthase
LKFDFYTGEILLVDKPLTWTSFQAVNKIKHAVKYHPSMVRDGVRSKPKVGHAGTLDPLATGLLIVCTGKRTKTINELMDLEKEYTGTFVLGATTPCYDLEKPVDATYHTEHITEQMIMELAISFVGKQQQVPPVFSAIMVEGKRSYDLARAGEARELKARDIVITEFEITRIAMPEINFRIACSKGTYIRSIARDFGLALNSGAYLGALRRTRIGKYTSDMADEPAVLAEKIRVDSEMR